MKHLLFTLILSCVAFTVQAQVATVLKDSAEVRERPRIRSEVVMVLPAGMSLEVEKLRGRTGELYVRSEFGYLLLEDITFGEYDPAQVNQTTIQAVSYVSTLLAKPPGELSEQEIMYLMLNEMRQQEEARSDLKKLKNAQVFQAVVTGAFLVASVVVALGSSN